MAEDPKNQELVEIRRAPKYLPFLLTGGGVGLVLALLVFFGTGQFAKADWANILGVLVLFLCAIGTFGGLYLVTVFDKLSKAKAKRTSATKLEQ
jgi:hypothetical protein